MKFTGCTLEESINMASKNPANLYGFKDRASLKVGKRADLILFKVEENKLDIVQTIISGKIVFNKLSVK